MMLLLVLEKIFSNTAEKSTSDGSEEAMTGLLAEEVATKATTNGTK